MAIQKFTVLNFPEKEFLENKQTRCSYPWENTSVGAGFLVPFADLGKKKSIPSPPSGLKRKGIRYEYAKISEGYLFKRVE